MSQRVIHASGPFPGSPGSCTGPDDADPGPGSFFAPALALPAEQMDVARAMRILHRRSGIVLGAHKRDMTARTLGLRARGLGCATVGAYLDLLEQDSQAPEWSAFIGAFTINHTAFFREPHHFRILAEFACKRTRPISVWCCASSSGEEPYSIVMALHEACGQPDATLSVLATDIDVEMVAQARRGVYTLDRTKPVAPDLLRRYFLRGTGRQTGLVRIKPVVRERVTFRELNLVSPGWLIDQKFDAIFCRNTMIYFDRKTQKQILERFVPLLKPGGLLFAGHSENFTYVSGRFRLLGQTVYEVA